MYWELGFSRTIDAQSHPLLPTIILLPHIHELVSGIAAYTYTSSRVNVSSAAFTVQVVALHSKAFFRQHGGRSSTQVVGLGNRSGSDDISRLLVHVRMKSGRGLNADGESLCIVFGMRVRLSCSCLAAHCVMYIMRSSHNLDCVGRVTAAWHNRSKAPPKVGSVLQQRGTKGAKLPKIGCENVKEIPSGIAAYT